MLTAQVRSGSSLEDRFRVKRNSSGWIEVSCPFCSEDDYHAKHRHLHISPDLTYAHCFRCNWKGSGLEVLRLINLHINETTYVKVPVKYEPLSNSVSIDKAPLNVQDYLKRRKALSFALTEGWKWDFDKKAIVIPVKSPGSSVKVFRFLEGDIRYSVEGERGKALYNFSWGWRGKRIFLVEGIFDAVSLRLAGYPSTLALLGKTITTYQRDLIMLLKPLQLILILDAPKKDPFIKNSILQIKKMFKDFVEVYELILPYGDPNDFSSEELRKFISSEVGCYAF